MIPYAQKFIVSSERQPDGTVPYAAVEAGLDLPEEVRVGFEEMTREHFRRLNPGVDISYSKWMTLYALPDPEDEDR
jgi:hypothetical protein